MPHFVDGEWQLDLGARILEGAVRFRVWAPRAKAVSVELTLGAALVPLEPTGDGYFEGTVTGIGAGARYRYVLDGEKFRPDPASRWQPDGVHAASAVVDPAAFRWTDAGWRGLPLEELIIYELHTGTFTPGGTFESIVPHLGYLKHEVGVTAIELMPVAQFPGSRNWGYDGVYPYAPHSSYGGPDGLKAFVDACHREGLAVILDVVYNHLGPEGNYLNDFGPYFTDRYRTPWGDAVNYDGPESDDVRRFVVSNALYWVAEYHVDGLRLDAVHGIYDFGALHILEELAAAVHAEAANLGRRVHVIAESDLNDPRLIAPPDQGGFGLDAQWNDDFHHALHTIVTGECTGYYQDFGTLQQLAAAMRDGFVYSGQRSRSRRRRHGRSSSGRRPAQFVVFAQNHDQIGNRAIGDRLSTSLPFACLKVVAAAVLLAPGVPLLFMGEEYGETAPFQYFIEHGDAALVEAVRIGRKAEFAYFGWKEEDIPDPQDPSTFIRSRLNLDKRYAGQQAALLRWTARLIETRKRMGFASLVPTVWTYQETRVLVLQREKSSGADTLLVLSFNDRATSIAWPQPHSAWIKALDAGSPDFGGTDHDCSPPRVHGLSQGDTVFLPPYAAVLYSRE